MNNVSHHSREQEVRQLLRSHWAALLHQSVERALSRAQEDESARQIAAAQWPDLPPAELALLDREDAAYLCRATGVPGSFEATLVELLVEGSGDVLAGIRDTNKYARGGRLQATIRQEVEHNRDDIRREIDRVFERRDTDRLAAPARVRASVLEHLNEQCLREVQQPHDDNTARRHLKALAALITPGGTIAERESRLASLTTGATRAFPYIPKYLSPGTIPAFRMFASQVGGFSYAGFTPSLSRLFPESAHVRGCLERFERREGILQLLIDPTSPITQSLAQEFAELDPYVQRDLGGIVMPKDLALEMSRRDGFKMPDGVICAVSLAVLIESVLRQSVIPLQLGGGVNQRPAEIVRRLRDTITLRPVTVATLEMVFDNRCLSPRDAMAHGAFFAGNEGLLHGGLVDMTNGLQHLVEDFTAAGVEVAVFQGPRWDAGRTIPADVLALIEEQGQPGLNLVDQMSDDEARAHVFRMLDGLTPDKAKMGKAAFLLWINGQRLEHEGIRDDTVDFAATYAGLIVLEELWRSVYEVYGERTLIVSDEGHGVAKCELAILDNRPGHLLEEATMRRVFGATCDDAGFLPSIDACRLIRDLVLHDVWSAVQPPYSRFAHILMKVLFTLCGAVGFRAE